jgi:hypothetical protein
MKATTWVLQFLNFKTALYILFKIKKNYLAWFGFNQLPKSGSSFCCIILFNITPLYIIHKDCGI